MTAPTPLPPEVEALVLAELGKRVKARTETTKALFGQRYPDGHRETFRSPLDGSKLGIIYRTDPDPQWKVTNPEALHAHLREYPGNVETVYEIADESAAIEVLREHAPHLLVEVTRVIPDVVAAALQQSRDTGEPAAPGIELVKPAGSLTVKPDPKAGAVVERMVTAGLISWDGSPRALDAGEVAS